MSRITDIILLTGMDDGGGEDEHPNVDRLNAALHHEQGYDDASKDWPLVQVNPHAGGTKVFCRDVFMAAINHLHTEEFLAAWRAIPWEDPYMVQLLIREEGEEKFTVYELEG